MKKSFLFMTGAALLLAGNVHARVNVSKYAITIDEPVTAQNTAAAWAECQKKGGNNPTVTLKQCDDAGLAAAVKAFPGLTKLSIENSKTLTSIAALKGTKLTRLTLKRLPALADLAPIAAITTLQSLEINAVGFKNADLSFCAPLGTLTKFELRDIPATFKTISGIEKCARIRSFTLSRNRGPVDLAPLAGFKTLQKVDLPYVKGLDLTPVTRMAALTDLSLYGAENLDLAPLAACPKLKSIMIYATKGIRDYNDLAKIKTLEFVNAGLSQMNDLSWAPQLPNLKKLSLFAETYKSYAPLAQCKKLENLTFWSMRHPVDVAQFADGVAPLKELSLSGSDVVNGAKLASLAKSGKLTSLNLSEVNKGKKPFDISFLPALPTLEKLELRKTKITDLSPVTKLPNLKRLTVDKNQKAQLEGKLNKNVRISTY